MRTISKTIHKEIWASSLPEDTRRRLGFLHSGLNTRSESNLRDIERNLRHAENIVQRISERLEEVKASEEGERFQITSEVRSAVSYLETVLEAASEFDAAYVVENDIRDLLDADGPIPFAETDDGSNDDEKRIVHLKDGKTVHFA